jgi:hypothetical protein
MLGTARNLADHWAAIPEPGSTGEIPEFAGI